MTRGKLLTTQAAAAYLGINVVRLRRFTAKGDIAVMRNANARVMGYYAADLDAWAERRRQPAAAEQFPRRADWRPVDERMRELIGKTS